MDINAIATLQDGSRVSGRLTTDHPASSYGQPVFVTDDDQPIDLWQIVDIKTHGKEKENEPPTPESCLDQEQ